jgi:hypothetical protein
MAHIMRDLRHRTNLHIPSKNNPSPGPAQTCGCLDEVVQNQLQFNAWSYRSLTLWVLGRPESALADVENAIKDARKTGHAATLLYALTCTNLTLIGCRDYEAVRAQSDEAIALADEKVGAPFWKAHAMIEQGCLLAFTGKSADAAHLIASGLGAYRSTGATLYVPWHLSSLASAPCGRWPI